MTQINNNVNPFLIAAQQAGQNQVRKTETETDVSIYEQISNETNLNDNTMSPDDYEEMLQILQEEYGNLDINNIPESMPEMPSIPNFPYNENNGNINEIPESDNTDLTANQKKKEEISAKIKEHKENNAPE